MDSSDDVTGYDTQYEHLPDRSRRICGGNRQKRCKMCQKWIDLGNSESGDNALVNHKGKRRCLVAVHNNKVEEERCTAAAALKNIRQTASLSPRTPYTKPQ